MNETKIQLLHDEDVQVQMNTSRRHPLHTQHFFHSEEKSMQQSLRPRMQRQHHITREFFTCCICFSHVKHEYCKVC